MHVKVAVIGAGPAGLTAAYLLSKARQKTVVFEADAAYVGGIARTVKYKGFHFDIGGHRFFSKSQEVEALWSEILPKDMLDRPRSSRIYYRGKFFAYPLKALEALFNLGFIESCLCVGSYFYARLYPVKPVKSFSDWVTNQFGKRLFSIFFKTYTEKVWGVECREISADWAAQRIKGLSLYTAVKNALIPRRKQKKSQAVIKTLIDHFRYPRKGPGMLWEACAEKIKSYHNEINMGCEVVGLAYSSDKKAWQVTYKDKDGCLETIFAEHVISSAPLRDLILKFLPSGISTSVRAAAKRLSYRDFLIVVLILKDRGMFSDNWIYVHDDKVDVARIQNFKSWSEEMVPNPDLTCYGLEYFCFEKDNLWATPDNVLIQKARRELLQLNLARAEDILDGYVVRQAKAYPVYDQNYQSHVNKIRNELVKNYPNLHVVGRNGMHKYNNQDHAMMTAMLTVKNILAGQTLYDVWHVNQDAEYHEAGSAGGAPEVGVRAVPNLITTP